MKEQSRGVEALLNTLVVDGGLQHLGWSVCRG
jgi:hypothetical protein